MSLIEIRNVSVVFRQRKARALLRDHLSRLVSRPAADGFYALRDVSFAVERGESVALLGANGAGKSTTLALISRLMPPDRGSVEVNATIAPLLELGSGFHPDLTARENLFLNAALLGMNRRQSEACYDSIVDFSELEGVMGEPVRTFSAGMVLRLAFSIATHADPGILLLDEVLGVGDTHFQNKCLVRLEELRAQQKTFVIVSHSPQTVREFCTRAIWLHLGQMVADGPARVVADAYDAFMASPDRPLPGSLPGCLCPPRS